MCAPEIERSWCHTASYTCAVAALDALHGRDIAWLPLHEFTFDPARSRDYLVRANWALYCDNYLEGFHIPYVHAALADALDYGEYRTELARYERVPPPLDEQVIAFP